MASGNATASFRTPLAALGTYTIRASDPAKTTATTLLRVIPRINLSEFSGDPGKEFRVYFYGYAPDDQVEVRLYSLDGATYQVIGTTTVAGNGRGTMLVTIPVWLRGGRAHDPGQRDRCRAQHLDQLHRDPGAVPAFAVEVVEQVQRHGRRDHDRLCAERHGHAVVAGWADAGPGDDRWGRECGDHVSGRRSIRSGTTRDGDRWGRAHRRGDAAGDPADQAERVLGRGRKPDPGLLLRLLAGRAGRDQVVRAGRDDVRGAEDRDDRGQRAGLDADRHSG